MSRSTPRQTRAQSLTLRSEQSRYRGKMRRIVLPIIVFLMAATGVTLANAVPAHAATCDDGIHRHVHPDAAWGICADAPPGKVDFRLVIRCRNDSDTVATITYGDWRRAGQGTRSWAFCPGFAPYITSRVNNTEIVFR